MNDQPYILDGPFIKVIREGCGVSLADLAVSMGMTRGSRTVLAKIEAGTRRPTKETAMKIADALGVFLSDITRHGPHVAPWIDPSRKPALAERNRSQKKPLGQRLAEKIEVNDAGCWIWQCRINQFGYGEIKLGARRLKAHRVSYEHHIGPIPEGHDLDHLCRVRPCVNPAHLEPVTRRENIQRGYASRRRAAA